MALTGSWSVPERSAVPNLHRDRPPATKLPLRRSLLALCGLLVALSGCARRAPSASTIPALPDRAADTLWYISARAREAGRDSRVLADSLEYGLVVHGYRRRADVLTGALQMTLDDTVLLSRDAFVAAVRAAADPADARATAATRASHDFALFYVHGYGTSLHECWQHASEARIRSRSGAPWVAFCWPSRGSGVAAPRRGAILDGGYRNDSTAAQASRPAYIRSAEVVLEALPPSRVLLVAHSMGAQLMGAALRDSTRLRTRLVHEPLRAIAFVAADVEANHFLDSIVPGVRPLTSRLAAYVSSRDRMLTLSKRRSGVERAGQRARTPRVLDQLEMIDGTDGVAAESRVQQWFGTHHAIRRASSIVFDLLHVVGPGRGPECRAQLATATRDTFGIWRLHAMLPATSTLATRCPEHMR